MGQEDALRGDVYWLVEPLYGKRIPRFVRSTHHQGARALANTHRLSLAALVTPVEWSVATMHTDIARSELGLFISLCKWQAVSWIVSKGGYEKHRSLVFLSIPPVPSRATSCSRLFADGCRCSYQASLNDMVGGFEPRTVLFQPC